MKKTTKILFFVLFLIPILGFSIKTYAVTQENDISIKANPTNPNPFSPITLTVTSFATDLNKASIEWRSGGKIVFSGVGKTSYSFNVGGPNTSVSFEITILPEGETGVIRKNFSIGVSDMDILWEAVDSYTPPFYKGKALPSKEGQLKLVAYPNTSGLSQATQKNITYTWKNNFETIKSASGTGKNKYIFTNSELKNIEKISVLVSGPNNSYNAEKSLTINMIEPEIIFYKKSPLEGILYENAITQNEYLEEDEITFVVEPYFLSYKNGASGFKYDWKINGESTSLPSNPRELTVRPQARGGYATLEFSIENLTKLFQNVVGSLRVEL